MSKQSDTSEYISPPVNIHSLFPAYSAPIDGSSEGVTRNVWQQNSSFQPHLISVETKNPPDTFNLVAPVVGPEISQNNEECASTEKKKLDSKNNIKRKKTQRKIPADISVTEESSSLYSHLRKLVFIEDTGLSVERAFHSDVKSDHENIAFGCPDRKHIAKYRLRVEVPLGVLPSELLLPLSISKKKKSKPPTRYFNPLKDKKCCSAGETIDMRKQSITNFSSDIILVDSTSNKSSEGVSPAFEGVSLDWKLKFDKTPAKFLVDDVALLEDISSESLIEREIQIKTVSFNKNLKENPQNELLWLDYLAFQDDVFFSLACYKNSSSLENIIREKKLAILEKALSHNPSSINLMLAKLELCKSVWETDRLISSWEQMLFLYPHNVKVWKEYLQFVLSDATYFTVPRILKHYGKCIRKLLSLHEGEFQSHQPSPDILENMLDIVSLLCHVLRTAGYTERALAIFQALIEFNLCTPPSLDASISCDQWVSFFEPFWDSGVSRFGEDNALGWCVTVAEKKMCSSTLVNFEDLNVIEDDILSRRHPQWKTWLEFEKLRGSFCWLPWRPNPDMDQTLDDSEDVDRTVSFEDISTFLFRLPSESLKFTLLCKFLAFLGVALHLKECNHFAENAKDAQISFETVGTLPDDLSDITDQKNTRDPFKVSAFSQYKNLSSFIGNVFEQAKCLFPSEYRNILSLLHLRYLIHQSVKNSNKSSTCQDMKNLKKVAKTFLKHSHSRNCLYLWKEYLLIEWMNGKRAETEDTFENLLMTSTDTSENEQNEGLFLFVRSYIELYMGIRSFGNEKRKCNSDDSTKAIWALSHIGSKQKYSKFRRDCCRPALVLKAVAGFKAEIDKEFTLAPNNVAFKCKCINPVMFPFVECAICLMYLQYFTQGMIVATQVFRETVGILSSKFEKMYGESLRSEMEELLFVSHAYLLNFHTWNSTSPLTTLRTFLFEAIEKFPTNACLLHLLAKMKSASSVVSHVRRFFHKLLSVNSELPPVSWLYSIASELTKCYSVQEPIMSEDPNLLHSIDRPTFSECGLIWKVRSLFEKALQSQYSKFCIYIWRVYFKFEIILGDTVRAKKILLRSLQHCVWSKILYMDAIEHFPDDFQYFLKVMGEKQLRIQTPLEEVVLLTEHATMNVE